MALDGSGSYQPPAPEFPAIPNTVILANDFNTIILDIAAALSQAIFRDGQAAFTANQSMGTHKITNLATGTNLADAVNLQQVFFDPSFIATTVDGFQVSGTMLKVLVSNMVLTALTLLDMSASGEVKLPSNTSIGLVSAMELALLNGLTASTVELNVLDGIMASTAELNLLDGVTATTAEINFLEGVSSALQAQLNAKAPLDSPAFVNAPTAPTAALAASNTQLANTEFTQLLIQQALTSVAAQAVSDMRLFYFSQL